MKFECPHCGAVRRVPTRGPKLKRTLTHTSTCPGCGKQMEFRGW